MAGRIRHLIPGGNTSKGFYSYYDYIIEKDANRIFVIKGGPGVGKSSMMKKIGQEMLDKGYDVEYHHCSSDNDSLDGLVIPKLNVAFLDGTAPHVVDPKNPGAVDEIIHLGDYWDLDKMEANKKEILEINTEVGKLFKRAYKYLGAARPILESIIERNTEAMDFGKVNVETYKLINEIFEDIPVSKNAGEIRHLFGSAYTPNGWVEYTDSVLEDAKNVYYINGDAGSGKTTLFTKVFNEAIASGFDVEVYHTPLIPERIETIYIPKLKIGLTSSEIFRRNNYKTLNLNGLLDQNKISKYKDQIDFDKRIFVELIDRGIQNISMAKKKHDLMEQYYVPNMDFAKVENLRGNLIKRVLRYEENSGE